jgi:CDP-diacylglycerol--glycerol-3-phosphate 3-phosphatidyltransferase
MATMDKDRTRSASIFLLPNLLSASRIAAAPVLAWVVLTAQAPALAVAIVVAAALTDLLDGVAARATGQVSELGAVLDPIADKIFILTALWLLWGEVIIRGLSAWAVLIILWREILISGLRDYARFEGLSASVSPVAKLKTAAQLSTVVLLFAARVPSWKPDLLLGTGTDLLWVSAGLALYTGADYFLHAWRGSWK